MIEKRTRRAKDRSTNVKTVKEEEHKHSTPKKGDVGACAKTGKKANETIECEASSVRLELKHVDISTYSSSHSGVSSLPFPSFSSHFHSYNLLVIFIK